MAADKKFEEMGHQGDGLMADSLWFSYKLLLFGLHVWLVYIATYGNKAALAYLLFLAAMSGLTTIRRPHSRRHGPRHPR